jgi:hypothetical protein
MAMTVLIEELLAQDALRLQSHPWILLSKCFLKIFQNVTRTESKYF